MGRMFRWRRTSGYGTPAAESAPRDNLARSRTRRGPGRPAGWHVTLDRGPSNRQAFCSFNAPAVMIAHALAYAAYRRTLVAGALASRPRHRRGQPLRADGMAFSIRPDRAGEYSGGKLSARGQ